MKDTSAPDAPNPQVTIPLQGAENRKTFDYQLGQMRTNTAGPTGTQSWEKTPVFDEAAYNAALGEWQGKNTQGTWVPEGYTAGPGDTGSILTPGYWTGATSSGTPSPSKEDFTTYNWAQTTTLSPEQQALYDTNVKNQQGQADVSGMLTNQLRSGLGAPIDFSGVSDPSGYFSGLAERSLGDTFSTDLADAAYRQQTRYLDPQIKRERETLQANLSDQGFVPGTPGYDRAMTNFLDSNSRTYGAARDSAIGQGYAQGNTRLSQQAQIAQLLSGQRQQGISELLTRRNQPLNELAALRGGTGVQMPTGGGEGSTPNLMPTDLMGAYNNQYQGQLGQYGANVSSNNQLMSGLASLAALFLGGSDRRFKTDISRVGELPSGIPLYTFRYLTRRNLFLGVMADEVEKILPEAVLRDENGYASVFYGMLR